MMLVIGFAHVVTGVVGLFNLDDFASVTVWRQPLFILQRGMIASLVIVIVNRNRRLAQIAGQ
jgi:hypothetical protein